MIQVIQSRPHVCPPQPLPCAPALRSKRKQLRPDDSADGAAHRGWWIIAVFFGLIGTWSMLAPLNGAVVASAEVKVNGNRKSIQHLEGGIVKELRVRDGDQVAAGDTLIVLDDNQYRSDFEVLAQLDTVLRLTQARLQGEQDGTKELVLPPFLANRARDPDVIAAWRSQLAQYEAHRHENGGQGEIIKQRIAQLESQTLGAQAQLAALTNQHASMQTELKSLQPLLEQGIVTRARLLLLERSIAALQGQIGEASSNTARAQQGIAEQQQLEAQSRNQRATVVAQELRDIQMRLAEVGPKLANARSVLERTVVRAPYGGHVVALNVFAVGAVIGRGEKLMDIVPSDGALIIEARIAVEDAGDVFRDARAEVRLSGYKQQSTPALHGVVEHVSADRLTDARTAAPYFLANIRIDDAELAAFPEIKIRPGMAATVMVPTTQRTALQYLLGPLWSSFNQAFRER